MIKDDLKLALEERFSFVLEDAKTYIYVRKEGIQDREGLGGGNFAIAYSLFALLNLASKVHYFLHTPQKFTSIEYADKTKALKDKIINESRSAEEKKIIKDIFVIPRVMETNEHNAFIEFARELESKGIKIHEEHESSHKDFSTIWLGFRNMLAHLATVQNGKGVMAYKLEKHWPNNIRQSTPLDRVLDLIKNERLKFPPFFYVNNRSGWIMNVDVLVSLIPDIQSITYKCLEDSTLKDDQLKKLFDFIQPT